MAISYTETATLTFTVTNARYLASKVRTDLTRIRRLYDVPSEELINQYEAELVEFLRGGYLETVTYGFKRNGNWIEPTLRYSAKSLIDGTNDDPGGISARADVSGATFWSYLTYSGKWFSAQQSDRDAFGLTLPFKRGAADEPGVNGNLQDDRSYYSGGVGLNRQSVKGSTK